MLGDEDSVTCDENEIHSALKDLRHFSFNFLHCTDQTMPSTRSSIITYFTREVANVNHPTLIQSTYYPRHNEEEAVPQIKATLPRSKSTLSNRTFQSPSSKSRLLSPCQAPSYADNTVCSKSRLSSASTSPYATMRRSISTTSSCISTSSPLERKPSSTNDQRPTIPPKPAGLSPVHALTRQSSRLNKGRNPESPITGRRTSSVSSPATRSFIAAGKQVSTIQSTPSKRIQDDRYATLGRRPKHGSPSVVPTSPSNSNNSLPTTSTFMDSSMLMKATADKFATLSRRKPVKDRPILPKPSQLDSSRSIKRSFSGETLPRQRKLSSPTLFTSCSTFQKEEECFHLVRLAEQRRHELATLHAYLKGAEGLAGSVLLAQGAQLSAAATGLLKLHSRMDGLLQSLMQSHRLPASELESLVFLNEAYKSQEISPQPTVDVTSPPSPASTPVESPSISSTSPGVQLQQQQYIQKLVGSTSLQDLSDAINLTRRRLGPEGREEPNPVLDKELRLAASLMDQIKEADLICILSKLLRVLRRLILDKDSNMQQLSVNKEKLLTSLSAQSNA